MKVVKLEAFKWEVKWGGERIAALSGRIWVKGLDLEAVSGLTVQEEKQPWIVTLNLIEKSEWGLDEELAIGAITVGMINRLKDSECKALPELAYRAVT